MESKDREGKCWGEAAAGGSSPAPFFERPMEDINQNQNQQPAQPVATQKPKAGPGNIKSNRAHAKKITLKKVLEAVEKAGGSCTDTAMFLGVSVQYFYKKWRYVPEVNQAFEDYYEIGFNQVTETLYEQACKGNIKAITTYLRYNPIAKKKGWLDHQVLTFREEKPLTDEEKNELKARLFG